MHRAVAMLAGAALVGSLTGARASPFEVGYTVSQSGLPVLDVHLALHLTDASYRLTSVSRARGLARLFLPSEQRAEVLGGLAGRDVRPLRYMTEGNWRGGPRRTVLDYIGGSPRLAVLEPPEGPDRIPVPSDQIAGTIDSLSALVRLSLAAFRDRSVRHGRLGLRRAAAPGMVFANARDRPGADGGRARPRRCAARWKAAWSPASGAATTRRRPASRATPRPGSRCSAPACRRCRCRWSSPRPSSARCGSTWCASALQAQ